MVDLNQLPDVLLEIVMKTKWADRHLKEFEHGVDKWMSSNPYRVSIEDQVLNGRHVRRLHIAAMSPQLPLHFSDFIHQLRSSLDHITWQLCLKGNPNPSEKESRDIMFPIQEKENAENLARLTKGMPQGAVDFIKSIQPYQKGADYKDDLLWQLNKLANLDKHRSFAMNGGHDVSMFAHPGGFTHTDFDWGSEFSWPMSMKPAVVFEPYVANLMIGEPVRVRGGFIVPKERPREILNYVRKEVLTKLGRFVVAS